MWQGLAVVLMMTILEVGGVGLPLAMPFLVACVLVLGGDCEWEIELALLGGLVVDFFHLNRLGESSLLLLGLGLAVVAVKLTLRKRLWVYLWLLGVASLAIGEVWWGYWSWIRLVVGIAGLSLWFRFMSKPYGEHEVVLRTN